MMGLLIFQVFVVFNDFGRIISAPTVGKKSIARRACSWYNRTVNFGFKRRTFQIIL